MFAKNKNRSLESMCVKTISFFIISITFSCNSHYNSKQNPITISDSIVNHFLSLHNHFQTTRDAFGNYTLDLAFEGMLAVDRALNEDRYLPLVLGVMEKRNLSPSDTVPYKNQPFGCITFELFRATNDSDYLAPFIFESRKFYSEITRTPEGAICLKRDQPGRYLLIDYLQEYASRMAKLGHFTGDEQYYKECVSQFELYRTLLRNPETGLYSQGRGWLEDSTLISPSAWSRGHGWLIRGMVRSLEYLPPGSDYQKRLIKLLHEFATDLLRVQDEDGMWHQLLHLPFEDSFPETSGTAFISYYISLAIQKGYLPRKPFSESAIKAFSELRKYIDSDGTIHGTCKGPGPLYAIDDWYRTPAGPDDEHAFGTMLFGLAGEILMNEE